MVKWFPYFFVIISILLTIFFMREQNKYHVWINTYWGKKPTLIRKFQLGCYLLAMLLLLGSLADWRGQEVLSEGKKSTEKTILLLDNSLSMLAEDVRPNRYEKAILMARHFLKGSPGHEIAVLLYSEVTKKYVPFTTDIDLLDARLSGLKEMYKNVGGSSNTKQAIREALDYLDPNPLARKGNIIVFTDADATDEEFPLEVTGPVSVAVIAIGTAAGGSIPMRGSDGVLRGYKNYQGQQVTSKLNQKFLDSLGSQIKNFKYWVVTSFSLPTAEILEFLKKKDLNVEGTNQQMRSREVLYEWWLLPGIFFLILSLLLRRFKAWTTILLISFMFINAIPENIQAQENKVKEIMPLLDALKNNELDEKGKLSVAQKILEAGDAKKATQIYQETLDGKKIKEDTKEDWINYAQALAANKQSEQAIKKMTQLQEYINGNNVSPEFKKSFSQNLLSLMNSLEQQQKEEKKKEEKEKKEQDQKKSEDKNQQGKPGDEKNPKNNEGEQEDQSKSEGDKEKDKKEENKNQPEQKENQNKSRAERHKELSPLLKQLLNEDRNLQQKLMDTSTKENNKQDRHGSETKDW